jgi:hypothetical protein
MSDDFARMRHEFELYVKSNQNRFDDVFATLCFASLALSLQFSERDNSIARPVLVISWILYLVAALLAGWRMMAAPQFDKINLAKNQLSSFVTQRRIDFTNPYWMQCLREGRFVDPDSAAVMTQDAAVAGFRKAENNLAEATLNLDNLQRTLTLRFNWSLRLFVGALVLNGTYLSINFLRDNSETLHVNARPLDSDSSSTHPAQGSPASPGPTGDASGK